MGEGHKEAGSYYVDGWTKEAFTDAGGGDYITEKELAHMGQVFRSDEGLDIFEELTGIHITGKADMRKLFESAAKGEINLSGVLKSSRLKKYSARTGQFGID